MDAEAARERLAAQGLCFERIEPVGEQGWSSEVYELDGTHIVRFPRNDEVRAAHERERRLLPALAAHVSFRVPLPVHDELFVYEKIPGRPFDVGDDVDAAFAAIDDLHSFPVDEARRLLGRRTLVEEYANEWEMFAAQVLPHLSADLVEAIQFARFPPDIERERLIHDDLGPEHLLVGDDGRPVAMIDFEDATVGDPAVDHTPLTTLVGRPLTRRMWQYHVRGNLHAIAYYHREGLHHELPEAVVELRRRLDLRPER